MTSGLVITRNDISLEVGSLHVLVHKYQKKGLLGLKSNRALKQSSLLDILTK